MLEFSKRTNTLEQTEYKYSLQDVAEPHLYRSLFNYDEAPKIPFNHRHVPMRPPEEIWITDSTFRDGDRHAGIHADAGAAGGAGQRGTDHHGRVRAAGRQL